MKTVEAQILVGKGETIYRGKKEITFRGVSELVPEGDGSKKLECRQPLADTYFHIFEDSEYYPAVQSYLQVCQRYKHLNGDNLQLKVNQDNNVISLSRGSLQNYKNKIVARFNDR